MFSLFLLYTDLLNQHLCIELPNKNLFNLKRMALHSSDRLLDNNFVVVFKIETLFPFHVCNQCFLLFKRNNFFCCLTLKPYKTTAISSDSLGHNIQSTQIPINEQGILMAACWLTGIKGQIRKRGWNVSKERIILNTKYKILVIEFCLL